MPDMFTGREFACELRFVRGAPVVLKGLTREVYLSYRVSYHGRDTDWRPFGDPLPLITDTDHKLHSFYVHDVFHFALAELTRWSPVVRDGLFGVEGQWQGPDAAMLTEEAIVFNEWRSPATKASLEWCLETAHQGGASCGLRDMREALEFGKAEHARAVRDFARFGESRHVFSIRMLDKAFHYGSGKLTGVGADGRIPDQ